MAGQGCVVFQEQEFGDLNINVAPAAGRLTGFRARRVNGAYRLNVYRGSNGADVGQSPVYVGGGADAIVNHPLTPAIPVQAGDFIAIELDAGATVGVRDATADFPTTRLLEYNLGGAQQDDELAELFLSATFQPNAVSTPVVPPKPVIPPPPDPLAALRAGGRPSARLSGGTVKISKRGVGAINVTNPNGYALKGTLSVAAGRLKLGRARVSLAANATKAIKFKLSRKALRRLRKKRRLRAIATAKLKGPIGKTRTIRKKLTLRAPAKPRRKKKRTPPSGGQGPSSNLWLARNGTSGPYDDFKFRLDGGNINLTGTSLLFVSCFEIGGSYRSSSSLEVFNLLGPWRLGNKDATQQRRSRAVNQLVSSGERTITYTLTSSRSGNRITGQRKMNFSDSNYDPFTNTISSIFCSGTQNYEAIPG